ncbi:hypothetical protein CAPTEDRAFT_130000 [Capitella teleta]|uniref:Reverse transcriptase domain-containing protein n=1 Tax=Capitella teleta TaxID=283909 RepID=R7T4U4_CAPTE|nr:hypothetical protein CAPTEDRAFT_130000 [Capitella teleta]|eukprot:ELT87916.1 hypothetical protein CAPTEDRAFT_130000 [Capitella teleta]
MNSTPLSLTSAGIDDIKPIIIKEFSQLIIKPLLHIFNLSFTQGSVPCAMKKANVTHIFKGGDPTSLGNYRPISVLPVFSNP